MRILLSNTCYQKRVEYTSLISVVPPLDLAYCAAVIRQKLPACTVGVLDANVLGLSDDAHVERVRRADPDVLIVSAATYAINGARRLLASAGRDGLRTILIGTHGSALPDETMAEIPNLDLIVRGEPEETIADVVEHVAAGRPLWPVAGITWRHGGEIAHTDGRAWIEDLDALPLPARDLLPNDLYSSPYSTKVTALRTTRGCPGRCSFCDSHLQFGSRIRTRSPELVVDEIEECARRYGTRYFAIIDHTFTARRDFVQAVCEQIVRRPVLARIRWACNTRVDMLTEPLTRLMRRAGCLQVGIGIESAEDDRLERVKKGITEEQIREAIARLKRCGIIAMGYSIVGFPEDTRESILRTEAKLRDLDPHTLQLSFATPLPGTKLREQCEREGRVPDTSWDDYVFLRKSIVKNDDLTPDELAELRRGIVKRFYFRPAKLASLVWFFAVRARVDVVAAARAFLQIVRNVGK